MAQPNLTTLSNVKAWLSVTTSTDDALLTRLIAQASRFIYGYLQRPALFKHICTERYDGPGRERLILRQWPVLEVSSLTVGVTSVPAAASYGQAGYLLEAWSGYPPGGPQALDLCGYAFCQGKGNVAVTYTAGYAVVDEAQTVPADPYQVTVDAPYGNFAVDEGVTYASGTALTKVSSSPAVGEYSVDSSGVYTFSAADTGQSVLISYSYIPADIEQLCIEIVAERYRYRSRIGETSKSLGGQQTAAYQITDLPPYLKALAQPYMQTILA